MQTTSPKVYDIYFNHELEVVTMEWNGYATSAELREGTELMLNMLIKNNCSKVLADLSDMVLIGMDDQKWINTIFLPRAIQFGFKSIAIIKPQSHFNKVAVENVSEKTDKAKLTISFFDNQDDAAQWLKKEHSSVDSKKK